MEKIEYFCDSDMRNMKQSIKILCWVSLVTVMLSAQMTSAAGEETITFADGSKYVGEFKDGKEHGQGTYTWPDGAKYVGEFRDGKRNGQGTYTYADGAQYVGEYKDDKYHGQGTYTLSDGRRYVGEYKIGIPWNGTTYDKHRNVTGIVANGAWKGVASRREPESRQVTRYFDQNSLKWKTAGDPKKDTVYVGEVRNDFPHGQGTLTFPDGRTYVGEFRDGLPNGQGTLTIPDGEQYVGEYKDGKPWNGTAYDKYGNVEGTTSNGVVK